MNIPPLPLVSVMIPTFNEADHIAEAVANARQLGPVFVLDSLSTDSTQEWPGKPARSSSNIPSSLRAAKKLGVGSSSHCHALGFILDADERLTPALRDEILRRLSRHPPPTVISSTACSSSWAASCASGNVSLVEFALMRLGARPLRGALGPRTRRVPEPPIICGRNACTWRRESITIFAKAHPLCEMESDEWIHRAAGHSRNASTGDLFKNPAGGCACGNGCGERLAIHAARPLWRFIYMYFLRLGIFDGEAGWHLALLMASYEYMITMFYRDKLRGGSD